MENDRLDRALHLVAFMTVGGDDVHDFAGNSVLVGERDSAEWMPHLLPKFSLNHDIQNVTPKNLEKYAKIEAFAGEHGVDFYPAGTGISHQVMVEQGYVVPGALVVASDSHSNLYGAIAALGTPVVRTDAASIWAT